MALVAALKDGAFVTNTASSQSLSKAKETNSSGMDSDAFLTLLVAEMQNQDPLEPTSNTEWISQYATFTQVSEIQEIGDNMNSMKADTLVGEHVIMKVTDDNGESNYVSGKVDYVVYEEGEAYLSINNSLYSIKDLDTVASNEYMEAYELATDVADRMNNLPKLDALTTSYKDEVYALNEIANNMTKYQKSFLEESTFTTIKSYYDKMVELVAEERTIAESAAKGITSTNTATNNNGNANTSNTTNTTNDEAGTGAAASESASDNGVSEEAVNKLLSDN